MVLFAIWGNRNMEPRTEEITGAALDRLKRGGSDYGDVRVVRLRRQDITVEDTFVRSIAEEDLIGFGVRALRKGSWGFASSTGYDPTEAARAADLAVEMAVANAAASRGGPITQSEEEPAQGRYDTPAEVDPFTVPLAQKIGLLASIGESARSQKGVSKVVSVMTFHGIHRTFVSTEGAQFQSNVTQAAAEYRVWAVGQGRAKMRNHSIPPCTGGYERVRESDLLSEAPRVGREAVAHLNARPVKPGRKDLILMPSHLALTIHESVGHATELDRALGMEESLAGRSFAVPELLGKLQYGSPHVSFRADNTLPGGLATMGWDDDGVPGQAWDIVRDGLFVGYSTNREVAGHIGQTRSMGGNRADSWASFPIVRIPNLSLGPGQDRLSLDELIADTSDGILIDGMGSFSIDQMRMNFQFGGNAFFEIKNGKIGQQLRDVTYQSITTDFWNACDAVCDDRFWQPYGILNCGKGDPMQVSRMTHGASPARFRNILVGGIS
jgi:TldD protein